MRLALRLARQGEGGTRPNPPVGAVVVRGNRQIAGGFHRRAGGPHAEVDALRKAGARARGATLYVTLEPCCTFGRTPPCTDLILETGIRRVVVAIRDPNPKHRGRGIRLLRRAGVRVDEGVCAQEAAELLAPFAHWIVSGRPFVTLKLGMTLDGRIADAKGKSRWITGPESRRAVHELRRRADAVMVGVETALADDPSLLPEKPWPGRTLRIVVDSRGRLPCGAKVLTDGHADQTLIATTSACPAARQRRYRRTGAMVLPLPSAKGHVSLSALMRALGRQGLLHVLCEGGGELAAALVRERLVDRFELFIAPRILGGRGTVPAFGGTGWLLGSAPRLELLECRRRGGDIQLTLSGDSRAGGGPETGLYYSGSGY